MVNANASSLEDDHDRCSIMVFVMNYGATILPVYSLLKDIESIAIMHPVQSKRM